MHYLRTLRWMREIGMEETRVHTFIGDVQAPLDENIRSAMVALFQMRWEQVEPELTQEDWSEFQRIEEVCSCG